MPEIIVLSTDIVEAIVPDVTGKDDRGFIILIGPKAELDGGSLHLLVRPDASAGPFILLDTELGPNTLKAYPVGPFIEVALTLYGSRGATDLHILFNTYRGLA